MTRASSYYDGGSLHIEGYDSIYDPLPEALTGDIAFYTALARRCGGAALEIGCGTGRVALALAQAGIEIVGIDKAEDMLATTRTKLSLLPIAVQRRLDLRRADMRDFTLDRRFATTIVPFRTFHLLLTEADQLSCLAAIHRHLDAGGLLALHLFNPPHDIVEHAKDPFDANERGVSAVTGRRIIARAGACTVDAAQQVWRDMWCYRELAPDGTVLREQQLELALRWLWPEQTRDLLNRAGFAIEAQYGDFLGGGLRRGGEQIWVAAKR